MDGKIMYELMHLCMTVTSRTATATYHSSCTANQAANPESVRLGSFDLLVGSGNMVFASRTIKYKFEFRSRTMRT